MQSLFEIVSYIAGSILHRPDQFHWLMLGSCGAISSAGVLYAAYVARHSRGEGGGCCGLLLGGRRPQQPYHQLVEIGGFTDGGGDRDSSSAG
jgi:hypothetical protein